jgi:BirA family biotin operon repressor/biotin-[acetyl-CoA-carboxylase] ligase
MSLSASRLQAALSPREVQFFEQTGSTNDIALEWLRQGAAAGSVVIANEQIKGRGRKGRVWHTRPGTALALSVILRPEAETLSQIGMLGAAVIAELCEIVGLKTVGVKWPNDVQIGGRKVSGVLPEAIWDGSRLVGVVLGMGVNVRMNFEDTELAELATSIEPELGKPVNRVDLLVNLLARVDYWAQNLGGAALFETWKRYLTTLGQDVCVETPDGVTCGRAEAVDELGALLVRTDDNTLHRIIAGDIALGSTGVPE